jgi:hypothetical protein
MIDPEKLENAIEMVRSNKLFGLYTTFDPCVNRHLKHTKSKKILKKILTSIAAVNDNFTLYVDATKS